MLSILVNKTHFFRLLIAVLITLFFSATIAADVKSDVDSELRPLSSLYPNELLYSMYTMRDQARLLPPEVGIYIARANVGVDPIANPFSLGLTLLSSHLLIEVGSEGVWSNSIEHTVIEGITGARGYALIGELYRSSCYAKIGYGVIPFGRQASAIIAPQNSVTRAMLDGRMIMIGVGADYPSLIHRLQSALSLGILPNGQGLAYIFNTQYKSTHDLSLGNWLRVCSLLGGGIGCIEKVNDRKWLFNLYGHMNFQKVYDCCFEYTYDALATQVVKTDEWGMEALYFFTPRNLFIEFSKHFLQKPMIQGMNQLTLVIGYESGSRRLEAVHNLFGALKLDLFKKHVTLAPGIQWNFREHALAFFARGSISL